MAFFFPTKIIGFKEPRDSENKIAKKRYTSIYHRSTGLEELTEPSGNVWPERCDTPIAGRWLYVLMIGLGSGGVASSTAAQSPRK